LTNTYRPPASLIQTRAGIWPIRSEEKCSRSPVIDGDGCADIFFFALTGRHARQPAGFRGLKNSDFGSRLAEVVVSKIWRIAVPIAPPASSASPLLQALSVSPFTVPRSDISDSCDSNSVMSGEKYPQLALCVKRRIWRNLSAFKSDVETESGENSAPHKMRVMASPTSLNGAAIIVPTALKVDPTTLSCPITLSWLLVVVVVVVLVSSGVPSGALVVVYVVWLLVSEQD
jgi:hypothetical protein